MPSFSTITEMSTFIKSKLKDINKEVVAKEMKKQYTKAIEDTVYRSPSEWSTGSFLNSVNTRDKTTKNTTSVTAFIDERLFTTTYPSWSPDIYGDNHKSEIKYWIEYGHGGMATVQGRGYYKLLVSEYFNQQTFKNIVISELEKSGIKAR